MWGAPGTMLAALFLYERTGEGRWADLFRFLFARLRSELTWSAEYECHYWVQDLYGRQRCFLDGIHGFIATALPLIRGRHLLRPSVWETWRKTIADTIRRTATWDGTLLNWRPQLHQSSAGTMLMQICHGAPGFVVCWADFPGADLDDLLLAAGETIWAAGPLRKGSNLCHGTGGNGYAVLKLYARTGNPLWLRRARAFAMHGIQQTEADQRRYGMMRSRYGPVMLDLPSTCGTACRRRPASRRWMYLTSIKSSFGATSQLPSSGH